MGTAICLHAAGIARSLTKPNACRVIKTRPDVYLGYPLHRYHALTGVCHQGLASHVSYGNMAGRRIGIPEYSRTAAPIRFCCPLHCLSSYPYSGLSLLCGLYQITRLSSLLRVKTQTYSSAHRVGKVPELDGAHPNAHQHQKCCSSGSPCWASQTKRQGKTPYGNKPTLSSGETSKTTAPKATA
jgi:hypothetical protein